MSTSSVRIRMYRQGLGDCFLLTFPQQTGSQASNFYMLIDCGVIGGTQNSTQKILAVVNDIFTTTSGRLDLVVGTHEHWDHLSGFNQARALFDKFQIGNVWLAWTEDPNNATAQALRRGRAAQLAALRSALAQMTDSSFADNKDRIEQILSFFGDGPGVAEDAEAAGLAAAGALPAAGGGTTQDAMSYLGSRKDASVHFCYPTKDPPLPLKGVDGVRIYVLGPPEDLTMIKMTDPTKKGQETYGISAFSADTSFFAAVAANSIAVAAKRAADAGSDTATGRDLRQSLYYPFDAYYQVPADEAQKSPFGDFFQKYYGFDENDPDSWRRIDNDWLSVAGELALNLDNDTNNTSLVLAIELGDPGSGKVLLFAADAQVGNWLSWGKLSWLVQAPGGTAKPVNASDLLARTVLYKVGHHGSHNATLRQQGLELMASDDLVAMIPVDHAMAVKKQWNMPFPDLYTRLQQKAKGRVMRVDSGLPDPSSTTLTAAEWQTFLKSAVQTDLYLEYTVDFPG